LYSPHQERAVGAPPRRHTQRAVHPFLLEAQRTVEAARGEPPRVQVIPQRGALPHKLVARLRAQRDEVHGRERGEARVAPQLVLVRRVPEQVGDAAVRACTRESERQREERRGGERRWRDGRGEGRGGEERRGRRGEGRMRGEARRGEARRGEERTCEEMRGGAMRGGCGGREDAEGGGSREREVEAPAMCFLFFVRLL
jgi:hypothetical protein